MEPSTGPDVYSRWDVVARLISDPWYSENLMRKARRVLFVALLLSFEVYRTTLHGTIKQILVSSRLEEMVAQFRPGFDALGKVFPTPLQ